MAKRSSGAIVRAFPVAARPPNITVRIPRAPGLTKRKSRGRRRSSASSSGSGALQRDIWGAAAGAFVLGMLDKQGTAIPTIPILGRAGTLAIAAHFLGRHFHSPVITKASIGFASIAAYELSREGKIAGMDVTGMDTV